MFLDNTPSFIEVQFPVSRISKESYKERKSNYSQTLTGLGKWWGRKPLVLVRACIVGLLMPTSSNPVKDREIFLKILTMDDEGLWLRKNKAIPQKVLFSFCNSQERSKWFEPGSSEEKAALIRGLSSEEKEEILRTVFYRMNYDEKLVYCDRPEQIEGPSPDSWQQINAHLGTKASSLSELIQELGQKRFGHIPKVGDAFCGGGSIPFEAARIGCEAYGSDLNPVAALLTWAALNIVGGGEEVADEVRKAQQEVYAAVDRQITAWGVEHRTEDISAKRWQELISNLDSEKITPDEISREVARADAYLYCVEVICPETGWQVPLAPSWVIGEKTMCIAELKPDYKNKRYDILIRSGVTKKELEAAKTGTIQGNLVTHPVLLEQNKSPATIEMIRNAGRNKDKTARYHENGLRLWENDDLVPRPDDVFQERLYCVRWVKEIQVVRANGKLAWDTVKEYRAVTDHDLAREKRCLELIKERFASWQEKGFIPSMVIEPGYNTEQPIRERGWTHWHHLFTPRQLITLGIISFSSRNLKNQTNVTASILGLCRSADYNSRLCRWHPHGANEKGEQVFSNHALNTLSNWTARAIKSLDTAFFLSFSSENTSYSLITTSDCRSAKQSNDFWITDPPFADAINYHEISEYFLSFLNSYLKKLFPDWFCNSKRALAIRGRDQDFKNGMVKSYRNLTNLMPDNGRQIVMFTHQDAGVWADLALILWSAGLEVQSAWCINTETDSALKQGNFVQGTVILVLRKAENQETIFLDELLPMIENEVKNQLDSMLKIDDADEPNFGDTDYQLAAYAAALRVLTRYKSIEDIDVNHELAKVRKAGEISPVEALIIEAVKVACDFLIPKGIDSIAWKTLTAEERYYLKGLDLERHAEQRVGAYMELARGFGIKDYKAFLGQTKAKTARLKTPSEFAAKNLGDEGFGASLVRQILFAVRETSKTNDTSAGRNWFRNEMKEVYWSNRKTIIEILRYLAAMEHHDLSHWLEDARSARLLAGAVENDHI